MKNKYLIIGCLVCTPLNACLAASSDTVAKEDNVYIKNEPLREVAEKHSSLVEKEYLVQHIYIKDQPNIEKPIPDGTVNSWGNFIGNYGWRHIDKKRNSLKKAPFYVGNGHELRPEMKLDLTKSFSTNNNDTMYEIRNYAGSKFAVNNNEYWISKRGISGELDKIPDNPKCDVLISAVTGSTGSILVNTDNWLLVQKPQVTTQMKLSIYDIHNPTQIKTVYSEKVVTADSLFNKSGQIIRSSAQANRAYNNDNFKRTWEFKKYPLVNSFSAPFDHLTKPYADVNICVKVINQATFPNSIVTNDMSSVLPSEKEDIAKVQKQYEGVMKGKLTPQLEAKDPNLFFNTAYKDKVEHRAVKYVGANYVSY